MRHPKTLIVSTALSACLFFAACQASPGAQREIDQIREDRAAAIAQRDEVRVELTTTQTRLEEIAVQLLDETEGTADERAAWQIDAAVLAERLGNLQAKVATLTASANNLDTQEKLVRSRDRGEQTGFWLNLIGTIAGGGALGKLLSKFGPSRGAQELDKVRVEMSAIEAAAKVFASSPSRGAAEVGRIGEKIAQIEGIIAAFSGGLTTPPVLPTPPPPPTPAG